MTILGTSKYQLNWLRPNHAKANQDLSTFLKLSTNNTLCCNCKHGKNLFKSNLNPRVMNLGCTNERKGMAIMVFEERHCLQQFQMKIISINYCLAMMNLWSTNEQKEMTIKYFKNANVCNNSIWKNFTFNLVTNIRIDKK